MVQHSPSRLFFAASVLVFSLLSAAPPAESAPTCPGDGIRRNTSGTTAIGATCNDALSHISSQEWPKMIAGCPYGIYDYVFVHNGCVYEGGAYRASGWFNYECQTNCRDVSVE